MHDYLLEADLVGTLAEALTANVNAVLADHSVAVVANAALGNALGMGAEEVRHPAKQIRTRRRECMSIGNDRSVHGE